MSDLQSGVFVSLEPSVNHYCLRMVAGPTPGKTWVLTEPVAAIGRGIGCHVRIEDPHVSRVQCEIVRDGNAFRLRSMGQLNPTCVNDRVCDDIALSPGDMISFANYLLILDRAAGSVPVADGGAGDFHTTRSFAESIEIRATFDADAYLQDPRLGSRVHGLIGFLRSLGQADSLEALVERLKSYVTERLKCDRIWIGCRRDANGGMVLMPPESPDITQSAPLAIMEECCESETGVMAKMPSEAGEICSIAAPLIHGGEAFGAIVVQRSDAAGGFNEFDLKFLVVVAECVAPMLRGAERLDQLRRDAVIIAGPQPYFTSMQGSSGAMQLLKAELRSAAIARLNVLIQGETGVGKELAARTLHDLSARASGPYVVVNCAAIAPGLFESEMFGHERGAFTGAVRMRKGLFEQAQGGTLFLDEVAELGLPSQALLLRAVETGTFRPVGSEKELKVDVRVVCATNRTLPNNSNTYFRTDLYHRLAGIVIRIQPLRERKEDILELAGNFLSIAAQHAPQHPIGFTQDAIDKLRDYHWPGNARELRNVVERACFMARTSFISGDDIRIDSMAHPNANAGIVSLGELERQHLLDMLKQYGNNVLEVAHALGISRSAVYYKLSRYGIKPRKLLR